MKPIDPSAIWWDTVPSALAFRNRILDSLESGRSVCLPSSSAVDWSEELGERIRSHLKESDAFRSVDILNGAQDSCRNLLLANYCPAREASALRPRTDLGTFFATKCPNSPLHNRYVWVCGLNEQTCREWLDFIGSYLSRRQGSTFEKAVFILEMAHGRLPAGCRGMDDFSGEQAATDFDVATFCSMLASVSSAGSAWKPYLSELLTGCCEGDPQTAARCALQAEAFIHNPHSVLEQIAREKKMQIRSSILQTRILQAQVRSAYPILEKYRQSALHRFADQIEALLPIENVKQEPMETLQDVDIGPLIYMMRYKQIDITQDFSSTFQAFFAARNALSHSEPADLRDLQTIFEWDQAQKQPGLFKRGS